MKQLLRFTSTLLCCFVGVLTAVEAQQPVLQLWDGPAPGSEKWTQQETSYSYTSPIWHEKNVAIFNVVEPTLTVFTPAAGTNTGVAVIVCPGGGFTALSWDNEGPNVARKLAEKGITAFVLKYRIGFAGATPDEVNLIARTSYGGEPRTSASSELTAKNNRMTQEMASNLGPQSFALTMNEPFVKPLGNIPLLAANDTRRAVEYVREHAQQWNLKQNKVALLGFSAGGMLALEVAFNHTYNNKPDLIGVIYGAMGFSGLPKDPMPLFMAATQNEATGGTAALYASWCGARLPAEIHSFTGSNHGFGYRENGDTVNSWIDLFYNFMKKTAFINE